MGDDQSNAEGSSKGKSSKKAGPVPSPKVCQSGGEESTFNFREMLELPWIQRIGPKQIAITRLFCPTIFTYTVAGVLATMYFCDWKAVLQYLPLWNGKYKEVIDEKALLAAAVAKREALDIASGDAGRPDNYNTEVVEEKDPRCP